MTERINSDFVKAYLALDGKLSESYGGIAGYLASAMAVRKYEKEGHPDFDRDINALQKMHTLYFSLIETKNVKAPIASEDGIDYLHDFANRLDEERDPMSTLKTPPADNNPEARKYLPIETEAREISRRVISQKKRIAIASVGAAFATVAIATLIQHKRRRK